MRPTTHSRRPVRRVRNILVALGWYFPEIHRGVARFARDHGWHLTADFDDLVPARWQGDGVITLLGAGQTIWRRLRNLKVPIVDLAESRDNIKLPRVTVDNAAIGCLAAEHFLTRGYRHFVFVQRWDLGVGRRRREAFEERLAVEGMRCDTLCWQKERGSRHDDRQQRHRWLVRCLKALPRPLAVFATRDTEAVEVIDACLSAGLAVPEQVAVLGVNNTETICDCLRVTLSSIQTNWERVGFEGAALLEGLLSGKPAPTSVRYISPSGVVERQSTDSRAVDHPLVAAALEFIQRHAHQPIRMIDVVKAVATSRSGLEKAFREHYIRAPMEELRVIRVARAQAMLRDTEESILAVAQKTGFATSHNLCRTFRQQLEMTPREYRHRQRETSESPGHDVSRGRQIVLATG